MKDRECEDVWMLGLCCEFGIGKEQVIKRAESLYKESVNGNMISHLLWAIGKKAKGD